MLKIESSPNIPSQPIWPRAIELYFDADSSDTIRSQELEPVTPQLLERTLVSEKLSGKEGDPVPRLAFNLLEH